MRRHGKIPTSEGNAAKSDKRDTVDIDLKRVCEDVAAEALARNTTDNVTVQIVSFHSRPRFDYISLMGTS